MLMPASQHKSVPAGNEGPDWSMPSPCLLMTASASTACRFYESEDELKRLFQSVNGLLLPVSARPGLPAEAGVLCLALRPALCRAS